MTKRKIDIDREEKREKTRSIFEIERGREREKYDRFYSKSVLILKKGQRNQIFIT